MSQEPSATAAEGIATTVQTVKEYADVVLEPPVNELGNIAPDTVDGWKFRNQMECVLKVRKFLHERKIDPKKLKPTIAVPLLEAAADTDDENLSDMFAELLTAHLDPARQDEVHPSFAKVMAQLSPLDAKMLSILDEMKHQDNLELGKNRHFKARTIQRAELLEEGVKRVDGATAGELGLCLDNLERLGLVENRENLNSSLGWLIPKYGQRFLVACNGPDYWRRWMIDFDRDDLRYEEMVMKRNLSAPYIIGDTNSE